MAMHESTLGDFDSLSPSSPEHFGDGIRTMTSETENSSSRPKAIPQRRRWRRAYVATSLVLGMLITTAAVLPFALIKTSLRNHVLGSAVNNDVLTATSENATGGWLMPLAFHNVKIADAAGQFVCTIRELRTSKGLLAHLTDATQAGLITLIEPQVEVRVSEDGRWPNCGKPAPSNSQLSYKIEDGAFRMIVPWRKVPIVDLAKLQLTGRVGDEPDGRRMLTVDAAQILDHEPLSEAHSQQNLALIAPVLSQSTQVEGSASVWIDEVQLPLDESPAGGATVPIRGRAEFHSLTARLKQDWTRQLTLLLGNVSGTELPDRVEVLKDARVDFVFADEGITHDGMVFLLPQIAEKLTVESSGVIHLDETLDLNLTVSLPPVAATARPVFALLAQFAREPLKLRVLGTVSDPLLQLPDSMSMLDEVSKRVAPAQYQEETPTVQSAISGLLQTVGNPDKEEARSDLPGNILNMIRAVNQNQGKRQDAEPRRRRKK
jgi:hypothetical protein